MKLAIDRAFGLLVAAVIVSVVVAIVVPGAELVAGVLAIPMLVLGIVIASRIQRIIALSLLGLGLAALGVALAFGDRPSIPQLLALNQDLTAMVTATTFVGIVAQGARESTPRLRGAAAVWRTVVVVHFLGSIVNTSAVTIAGDHLRRGRKLTDADAVLVTRSYMTSAFWSPFWAASAAAVAFVPDANLLVLGLVGITVAALALTVTMPNLLRQFGPDLPEYQGYALSWRLLRIPLALVVAVIAAQFIAPDTPIPRIVALASIAVTVIALLATSASTTAGTIWRHTRDSLPLMRGEVSLFTAAGVLTVGLGALFRALEVSIPIESFTVPIAWACTLAMVVASMLGLHQLISLGILASIMLPIDPQPTLFAMATMIGWGLASIVGPISGIQMFMQGRYGASPLKMTKRNLIFAGVVLVLAWPALLIVQAIGA